MTMQAHPTLQQDAGWWSPGSEVARWETDSMTTEHLTLRAEMSSVRVLRQELLRLCRDHGVDVDAAGDLVLAVSEAFT
ncbi:MAG TPA: hypothetical protein VK689_02390, partial [Armatimonadota bacterium]|nr:hypothetical protein [Armatimonadota bacterium]